MNPDPSPDEKHRRRANNTQALEQTRCKPKEPAAQSWPEALRVHFALGASQSEPDIIELHDGGYESVYRHGQSGRDETEHECLNEQGFGLHRAEHNHDDFRREYEVGEYRSLDLILLEYDEIYLRISEGARLFVRLARFGGAEMVPDLFETLEAEVATAEHEQRGDNEGRDGAEAEGGWDEDQFVQGAAAGDCPNDGQFSLWSNTCDLFGVEREVVAQYPCSFAGRRLA